MEGNRHSPVLAGILGFLSPGLGQVYNRETLRGVRFACAFGSAYLLMILLAPVRALFPAGIAMIPVMLGILVASIVDAVLRARRVPDAPRPTGHRRRIAWWLVATLLIGAFVPGWVKATRLELFRIPAESMKPTLLVGDYMLADRRLPARRPGRGDLVVFRFPPDPSKKFVKRVVALAGDRVESRAKRLVVNGVELAEPYAVHDDPETRPGSLDSRDEFGPLVVPPGHVFVIGDNRDHSNDSRYYGPVALELVLGRAVGLYWSWDPVGPGARWERIGRRL